MISTDLLKSFAEFGTLNEAQLKSISAITAEHGMKKGEIVFHEGKPATAMFLLMEGRVELYYVVEETMTNTSKEFQVGEITTGELFGLSALFEPYRYETTARVERDSRILTIDGLDLRKLMDKDRELAFMLMKQIVKIINQKLQKIRTELTATRTVA